MGFLLFRIVCLCHLFMFSATYLAWTRNQTFDDKLSTNGLNVIARSRLHCTRVCSQRSNCSSFFFALGQVLNCQLHENIIKCPKGLSSAPGSMYYTLDQAVQALTTTVPVVHAFTTTVSTVTTPPPFSCPPDNSIFRTVQLEDGIAFTYRVVTELRNQSESAASCQSLGGFLARVTTKPKMDMLLDLIINCLGYYGIDYYVDGSNAGATNFSANDAWVMSNGDLVPMTTDFWYTNSPDNPYTEHCLHMRIGAYYKWDDCQCGIKSAYICEM